MAGRKSIAPNTLDPWSTQEIIRDPLKGLKVHSTDCHPRTIICIVLENAHWSFTTVESDKPINSEPILFFLLSRRVIIYWSIIFTCFNISSPKLRQFFAYFNSSLGKLKAVFHSLSPNSQAHKYSHFLWHTLPLNDIWKWLLKTGFVFSWITKLNISKKLWFIKFKIKSHSPAYKCFYIAVCVATALLQLLNQPQLV